MLYECKFNIKRINREIIIDLMFLVNLNHVKNGF